MTSVSESLRRQDAAVVVRGPGLRRGRLGTASQGVGLGLVDRHEPHGVARTQLAQLPQLTERDGGRAREPAQRRAVGAEQDRQVARVVDRADGVRGVVDVRRVQARLAAVGPGPGGLGADEPHARARRVEVDRPGGRVELGDVARREELRCGVRTLERADLPGAGDVRPVVLGHRLRGPGRGTDRQLVARAQRHAGGAADPAEVERRRGAEHRRDVEPAADQQVRPHPGRRSADRQHAAGRDVDRLPLRDGGVVQGHRGGRAGHHHGRPGHEPELGAGHRALQPRSALGVAQRGVAQPERQVVHGPRRRDADVPQPGATGPVLDRA